MGEAAEHRGLQVRPADADAEGEVEIGPVLFRQRRNRQRSAGHIDALAVLQFAGRVGAGDDVALAALADRHLQLSVVELENVAGLQHVEQLLVRNRDDVVVVRLRRQGEFVFGAVAQFDASAGEGAGADFRSLQVGEHGNGNAGVALDIADGGGDGGQLVMVAVTHVEPENVDACIEKQAKHGGRRAGGADGRDDFAETVAHGRNATRFRRA